METALDAETTMLAAGRTGETDLVGGSVRVSAAEGFGTVILAPALASLRRQRPSLRIELAANSGFLSPTRREVDMAVTLSAPDNRRLVVEPLTYYQLMLYASPAYIERAGVPSSVEALSRHELVGYIDDLIYAPELRYLDEIGTRLRPTLASSSIRAQQEIIASGGGIGVLPCFLAQGLTPVLADDILLTRQFWISTHADFADSVRVKTVRHWLFDLVEARKLDLSPL
jgi:DNA-binding transcriptional LysR family regulator